MIDLGPKVPQNWYLLGPDHALRPGLIVSHAIHDHDLIVFRSQPGALPIAMDAHCAHMGCNLEKGTIDGDRLRCPLHHRMIGPDGRFAVNRDSAMRQRTYPVRVFMDGVFVFLGDPARAHDLDRLGLAGNAVCYAGENHFPLPWQWLVANGLDIEHLSAVHDRKLLKRPILESTGNEIFAVRYLTRPMSANWSDWMMARLAPDGIQGSIKSVYGSMMLVETKVGRRETFILMSFAPKPDGGTVIRGLVGVKGRPSLANRLSARIARLLFKSFLYKDLSVLDDMKWHAPTQIDGIGDEFTQAACAFFKSLAHA